MKQLKAFGAFLYDFVIGDDWQVAALVVAALAVTALLAHAARFPAWWTLPAVALAALVWSLHRATRLLQLPYTACKTLMPRSR